MTDRTLHEVQVAGLTRQLPIFEVAPGVRIAIFNMLGDTLVVKAAAAALVEQLNEVQADVLLTPEAKSIPLAYEMSSLMALPYVVLRKSVKPYMGKVVSSETVSITTGSPQILYLDEKDGDLIADKDILLVDDVISTGSTLKSMREIVARVGGRVVGVACVFTEGDGDWSKVIALGNLPVFLENTGDIQ